MQIEVGAKELKTALGKLSGVVKAKSPIPILACVRLEASAEEVWITGTDLEVTVGVSVPAAVKEEGIVVVSLAELKKAVGLGAGKGDRLTLSSLVRGDDVDSPNVTKWLAVAKGLASVELPAFHQDKWPTPPPKIGGESSVIEIREETLREMVKRVIFAILTGESRYTLNGVLLTADAAGLRLVATDGSRLSTVYKPDMPSVACRVLIPRCALANILKLAGEESVKITWDGGKEHICFQAAGWTLLTRVLTGQFPDYESIIPKENKLTASLDQGELLAALKEMLPFASTYTKQVLFTFQAGLLELSCGGPDAGKYSRMLPCGFSGEAQLKIWFDITYLLDFLAVRKTAGITLRFKDKRSAMISEVQEDGLSHTYVLMPGQT